MFFFVNLRLHNSWKQSYSYLFPRKKFISSVWTYKALCIKIMTSLKANHIQKLIRYWNYNFNSIQNSNLISLFFLILIRTDSFSTFRILTYSATMENSWVVTYYIHCWTLIVALKLDSFDVWSPLLIQII